MVFTNAYCKEKLTEIYLESIKLQACKANKNLKKILLLIPQEYNIFEVNNFSFSENEKRIFSNFHKNFLYFTDRSHPFSNFYIPSDFEILRLETQTSIDRIYHYTQYQPLYRIEEINNPKFFSQIDDFFKSPTLESKIEPVKINI
jgi:hypothetical protein